MPLIADDADEAQYATADDLAGRLGVEMTEDDRIRASALLARASRLVQEAATVEIMPDAVPATAAAIALEAVVRVWVNPGAVVGERHGSEQVQYMNGSPTGLLLTEAERRAIRKIGRRVLSISQAWPDEELPALTEEPL